MNDASQDIDRMTRKELNDLKRKVEHRLTSFGGKDNQAFVDRLAGQKKVDLLALAVKRTGIRCRTLDTGEPVTFRPGTGIRNEAEAHILTVKPGKVWVYNGTVYMSGQILGMRLDIPALKLVPLKLKDEGLWDPKEEYWGEEGEPVMDCFKPIIAAGPRPCFEMEQNLPGFDADDFDSDPIGQAVDLYEKGKAEESFRILHKCLEQDLRVLDAHAHLGNWCFGDGSRAFLAERAQKNYAAGVAIGELSLGPTFNGVLPWGMIDNRPFLRCLHGLGLCHWALEDFKKARGIFERMLWLNPSDNQGARFLLNQVNAGFNYKGSENEQKKG